ncbi:MAG: hypothetical protein RL196_1198 [Actinomycetota bacterium]|jgi:hypothetical protein
MTMTHSINPATKAQLEKLNAEIAEAALERQPVLPTASELEEQKSVLAAVVSRVLAEDGELLERLADA